MLQPKKNKDTGKGAAKTGAPDSPKVPQPGTDNTVPDIEKNI